MAFRIPTPIGRKADGAASLAEAPSAVFAEPVVDTVGYAGTAPIYAGGVRVVNLGPRSDRTAKFQVLEPNDALIHPFKGMRWSRSRSAAQDARGQRLHIVLSQHATEEGENDLTLYVGEGMLNWWSEDPASGMLVTLRFDASPEGADWHPLTGIEADRKSGDVIYLACWAIADDEEVQDPREARRASKPFTSLTAVQQSQIKCRKDERFQAFCIDEAPSLVPWEFVGGRAPGLPDPENPVAYAEAVVRSFCHVDSRSVFSQDTAQGFAARQTWQEMMRLYEHGRRNPSNHEGHPAIP